MKLLAILVLAISLYGCHGVAPDATEEAVLIKKPWFFGHGGIDPEPIRTGLHWAAWTTDAVLVPMQPTKYETDMADMMTSDGVPIEFHTIIVLQVTDSVALISHFGPDWYKNNVEEPFKTMVRQAVRKHGMNETAISTTALDEIDAEIRDALTAFIRDKSLPVRLITTTVGRANPPDAIKHQRIDTAAQEQRIQTEKQTKLAEDQRKMAEQSRADADNAYREAMHLSPEQFIQLKQIEMLKSACADSKSACTFVQGNATPVYNLGK
jgi:regulator of protease activity HflC (stomatin/prohibitin superfamily)